MTLGHIFAKRKECIAKEKRKDAIYSILGSDWDQEYLGRPYVSLERV